VKISSEGKAVIKKGAVREHFRGGGDDPTAVSDYAIKRSDSGHHLLWATIESASSRRLRIPSEALHRCGIAKKLAWRVRVQTGLSAPTMRSLALGNYLMFDQSDVPPRMKETLW